MSYFLGLDQSQVLFSESSRFLFKRLCKTFICIPFAHYVPLNPNEHISFSRKLFIFYWRVLYIYIFQPGTVLNPFTQQSQPKTNVLSNGLIWVMELILCHKPGQF